MAPPSKCLPKGILFTLQIIDSENIWVLRGRKPTYAQHKSKLMLGKTELLVLQQERKLNPPVGQVESGKPSKKEKRV